MAESREENRQVVNPADAVRELFARLPAAGKDLVWLADELIGIGQHLGSVSLEFERDAAGNQTLVCRSGSTAPPLSLTGQGPLHLFRPLLARLAVVGAEESGSECTPYGGRYVLARSSRTGPVRLELEFTNTPASQRLAITRTPVTMTRLSAAPTQPSTPDTSPQPAS
jgi:hypothetical protein